MGASGSNENQRLFSPVFPLSTLVRRATLKLKWKNYQYWRYTRYIHALLSRMWKLVNSERFDWVSCDPPTLKTRQCSDLQCSPHCLRVVCISDTHETHRQMDIPDGDILVHCGDILFSDSKRYKDWNSDQSQSDDIHPDSIKALKDFNQWLDELPHPCKIVCGGNHDFSLERMGKERARKVLSEADYYLENEGIQLDPVRFGALKVYASPHSVANSTKSPNKAWQRTPANEAWSLIPEDTELLITHMHPRLKSNEMIGCDDLKRYTDDHCPHLKLHVFGHWHGTHGVTFRDGVPRVNACSVNSYFVHCQRPIVVDLPVDRPKQD